MRGGRNFSVDMTSGFFGETKEQSLVKSAIVSKYFWAWAKVIMSRVSSTTKKIAYIELFAGPGRYKGLSLKLVNAVVKDWGCECIFFFNYNRINMGLSNALVEEHMNALFGKERADELRLKLETLSTPDRELMIVEELCKALNPTNDRYVLPFRFKDDRGTRTSHHLIFVSKHFLGYHIMKSVMAGESSKQEQGVATFEYSPADRNYTLLFEM